MEPVLCEILHMLPSTDMARCLGSNRLLAEVGSVPALWFRAYCVAYRGHLDPPPSFEELAAGAPTDLALDAFDWSSLCKHRAQLLSKKTLQERLSGTLQLSDPGRERLGMIDAEHVLQGYRLSGSISGGVLRERMEPLPLMRPIAYVELYVHGGASAGLVDSVSYPSSSHIGWRNKSIGYHGDEGSIYAEAGDALASFRAIGFGPTFGLDPQLVVPNDSSRAPRAADVIGVGIDFPPQQDAGNDEQGPAGAGMGTVFWTKNGEYVGGLPWPDADLRYFAFALHRRGDRASVNTGTSRFLFDIEGFSQKPRPKHGLV